MSKVKDQVQELRAMNEEQLSAKIDELREKRRTLLFQTKGDEIKDVHELGKMKKEIARALTILNEKRNINNR